ncbi:adenylate/guanylate cyclase domain-containing protein [Roseibium sp.]|uniref:adenylate/guanylate cyclase domain-containing protein n=1 Tax=Roseibium sp. TaxID=1936156 RepID=UPI003BAC9C21
MWFFPVARPPMTSRSVSEAIAREEAPGLAYVFWGRSAVLLILAAWVSLTLPFERAQLYLAAITAFAVLGTVPYALRHRYAAHTWLLPGFVLLDAAALSFVLIVPTPFDFEGWTQQMNLRTPAFLYLGVFVVSMALSYKPALVIWTGLAAAATWTLGYLWVATRPDAIPFTSGDVLDEGMGAAAALAKVLDPNAVGLARLSNQVVFLVLISVILTIVVVRSRALVRRQVAAEAQRAMLSRYFSPNIVREFAEGRWQPDEPGNRPVAVLFADMVDFTSISERLPPQDLRDKLNAVYSERLPLHIDHETFSLAVLYSLAGGEQQAISHVRAQAKRDFDEVDAIAQREMLAELPGTTNELIENLEGWGGE